MDRYQKLVTYLIGLHTRTQQWNFTIVSSWKIQEWRKKRNGKDPQIANQLSAPGQNEAVARSKSILHEECQHFWEIHTTTVDRKHTKIYSI